MPVQRRTHGVLAKLASGCEGKFYGNCNVEPSLRVSEL